MEVEKTGITIERRFAVTQALTIADGDKIKQVFWNFCENAVRAMRGGGKLTVSLESLGDDWQVGFTDTGAGMSPQQTEKIFEPFQSNFEGGTGLGLAIVYQIVQAHEGKVWARSKPGQGAKNLDPDLLSYVGGLVSIAHQAAHDCVHARGILRP